MSARDQLQSHELHDADYHGHHAVSFSQLQRCGLWTEDGLQWTPHLYPIPQETTDAMDRGTLTHASHYEPGKYAEMYAIRPVTKSGKLVANNTAEFGAWALENEGKIHISPSEHEKITSMIGVISGSSMLQRYRDKYELISTETAYSCVEPSTCLELRIKPDELRLTASGRLICGDLKTTKCKNPHEFQRECEVYKFAYYRRYAFYRRVLSIITGEAMEDIRVAMICVTNTEPHICYLAELREDKLNEGDMQNRDAMRELARCIETGVFMPNWMKDAVII